jgi:hypothetical protein
MTHLDLWTGGVIVAAVLAGWLVWSACRRIVRVGFFLINFCLGAALTFGGGFFLHREVLPWPAVACGGLVFAYAAGVVRSRIARAVTMGALLLVAQLLGAWMPEIRTLLSEPSQSEPSQSLPPDSASVRPS